MSPNPKILLTGNSGRQWVEPEELTVLEQLKNDDDTRDLEWSLGLGSCYQTQLQLTVLVVKDNQNCS